MPEFPFFIKIQGIDKISGSFKNIQAGLRNISKSAVQLGQKMTLALTLPALGAAVFGVHEYVESLKSIAQVQAGIASTGGKAGLSLKQLTDEASKLQSLTLFTDDEILKSLTAQFLTFGNITGSTFIQAQKAAVDLSARLGQDLQSSAIQLGKALNDPIKGINALSRVGVAFTESQKATIKHFVATNQLAKAQAVILKELQIEFGGSARAAREADPYTALRIEIGELAKSFGGLIHDFLSPLIKKLIEVMKWIEQLNTPTKSLILIIGIVIAAIGPLIFILGQLGLAISGLIGIMSLLGISTAALNFGSMLTSLKLVWTAVGMLTKSIWLQNAALFANPWVIAIAGIAALIIGIKHLLPLLEKVWNWFTNLKSIKNIFGGAKDAIGGLASFGGIKPINDNFNVSPVSASSFSGTSNSKNSVVVDFKNIPRGVAIDQGPQNNQDLSVNMGYSMMGFN